MAIDITNTLTIMIIIRSSVVITTVIIGIDVVMISILLVTSTATNGSDLEMGLADVYTTAQNGHT